MLKVSMPKSSIQGGIVLASFLNYSVSLADGSLNKLKKKQVDINQVSDFLSNHTKEAIGTGQARIIAPYAGID